MFRAILKCFGLCWHDWQAMEFFQRHWVGRPTVAWWKDRCKLCHKTRERFV